jgi:hypothetical protein
MREENPNIHLHGAEKKLNYYFVKKISEKLVIHSDVFVNSTVKIFTKFLATH